MTEVKAGDRVRVTGIMQNDPWPMEIGEEGTVRWIGQFFQDVTPIIVDWDSGRSLMLLKELDPFEVLTRSRRQGAAVNEGDEMTKSLEFRIDEEFEITLSGTTYQQCRAQVVAYQLGAAAIILESFDEVYGWERLCVATVNLEEKPTEGCVWIKDWSENAGILDELVKLGAGVATGREVPSGWVTVKEFMPAGELAAAVNAIEQRA